jgi:hypothetical protein
LKPPALVLPLELVVPVPLPLLCSLEDPLGLLALLEGDDVVVVPLLPELVLAPLLLLLLPLPLALVLEAWPASGVVVVLLLEQLNIKPEPTIRRATGEAVRIQFRVIERASG